MDEVEELSVHNEQTVDYNKQVVRVPECVEACQPIERLRELDEASTEPASGQCESHCHEDHH